MSQELAVNSYYQSLYNSNFLSPNIGAKMGMEFFLSTLLFKGDIKRVLYSKEDIAFRRRVETLGRGSVKREEFNYISLDLPFAVYSQAGTFEEDDRGSTQNVGQIVVGKTEPESGLKIRAAAVKVAYEATVFFGRRDDVNVASHLLYWEKTPKYPVLFGVEHEICGHPISIPFFITLDSFDSNVEYKEKDWLASSKIFPINCKFTIRSYQTLIENIDQYFDLPVRFSGLYHYNNDEIVYTQKTTLLWANTKWTIDEDNNSTFELEDDEQENIRIISVAQDARDKIDNGLIDHGRGEVEREHDETVQSAVEGYFAEDMDCTIDEFGQDMSVTTDNQVGIYWKIADANLPFFKSIIIYVPGILNVSIDEASKQEYLITDLYPGSVYDCTLITIAKNGSKLTYKLTLKTTGEPVLGKTLVANLVGKTFV